MTQLTPPYPFIRRALRQGRVIPFLGAGASLSDRDPNAVWNSDQATCLPSAAELALHLATMTAFPEGEQIELTTVAQYFEVAAGRWPLNQELHDIFEEDYPISSLHTFLARLGVPLLIVTTNYDNLIESAFAGQEYHRVIHIAGLTREQVLLWRHGEPEPEWVVPNELDIDLEEVTVIYKMHGAVDRHRPERDQYVITEDDYIDFLVRMTRNTAIPAVFAEPFQTRHFLFLGYGLRDWNLRVVLSRIDKDLRRPKSIRSWAIQHRSSPLERRFWQDRGVEVYDMTIEEFVQKLESS